MSRNAVGAVVLCLMGAFVGARALVKAWNTVYDNHRFGSASLSTIGTITDYKSIKSGNRRLASLVHAPVVRYQVSGRNYSVQADYGYDVTGANAHPIGSPLEVLYLEAQPETARVVGLTQDSWGVLGAFGATLLVTSVGGAGVILWLSRSRRSTDEQGASRRTTG